MRNPFPWFLLSEWKVITTLAPVTTTGQWRVPVVPHNVANSWLISLVIFRMSNLRMNTNQCSYMSRNKHLVRNCEIHLLPTKAFNWNELRYQSLLRSCRLGLSRVKEDINMYIKRLLSRNDTATVGVKCEFSMIGPILSPCVTKNVSKRVCVFSNVSCKSQFGGLI